MGAVCAPIISAAARLFAVAGPPSAAQQPPGAPGAQGALWPSAAIGSHGGPNWHSVQTPPVPLLVPYVLPAALVLDRKNPYGPEASELRRRVRLGLSRAYELAAARLEGAGELIGDALLDIHHPDEDKARLSRVEARARMFRRKASNIRACGWGQADAGGVLCRKSDGALVGGGDARPYLYGQRCSCRWCPPCGRRDVVRRRQRLAPLLEQEGRPEHFVLVTLSRRADAGETFSAAFDAVEGALKALRKSRDFREAWRAGIAGLEATYSTPQTRKARASRYETRAAVLEQDAPLWEGDDYVADPRALKRLDAASDLREQASRLRRGGSESHWHVHVHLVLAPRVRPRTREEREELREATRCAWASALGVGVVDCGVRIERPRRALSEVVKYAVKGVDVASMPTEQLVQLLTHLEGRRLIRVLGDWYGRRDIVAATSEHETPDVDEKQVGDDPARVLGYALGRAVDEKVRAGEVEVRTDAVALASARAYLAALWEGARTSPALGDAPAAAVPVRPPSTAPPPPRRFALPVTISAAPPRPARVTAAALSSCASLAAAERDDVRRRKEEARLEARFLRSAVRTVDAEANP